VLRVERVVTNGMPEGAVPGQPVRGAVCVGVPTAMFFSKGMSYAQPPE